MLGMTRKKLLVPQKLTLGHDSTGNRKWVHWFREQTWGQQEWHWAVDYHCCSPSQFHHCILQKRPNSSWLSTSQQCSTQQHKYQFTSWGKSSEGQVNKDVYLSSHKWSNFRTNIVGIENEVLFAQQTFHFNLRVVSVKKKPENTEWKWMCMYLNRLKPLLAREAVVQWLLDVHCLCFDDHDRHCCAMMTMTLITAIAAMPVFQAGATVVATNNPALPESGAFDWSQIKVIVEIDCNGPATSVKESSLETLTQCKCQGVETTKQN